MIDKQRGGEREGDPLSRSRSSFGAAPPFAFQAKSIPFGGLLVIYGIERCGGGFLYDVCFFVCDLDLENGPYFVFFLIDKIPLSPPYPPPRKTQPTNKPAVNETPQKKRSKLLTIGIADGWFRPP